MAEKAHGHRDNMGDSPWGHKELDKIEHEHTHTQFFKFNMLFLKLFTVYNKK